MFYQALDYCNSIKIIAVYRIFKKLFSNHVVQVEYYRKCSNYFKALIRSSLACQQIINSGVSVEPAVYNIMFYCLVIPDVSCVL